MLSPPYGGLSFLYHLSMKYQNTQRGTVVLLGMGFGIVMCLVIAMMVPMPPAVRWLVGCSSLILLFFAWLFGSLTVEIDGEELRHYFGPGFWRKTHLLMNIESAEVVRNSWLYGWGIRLTPHGWLYNVAGLEAVQILLKSGKKFRVGTNDGERLLETLQPLLKQ